MKNKTFCSKYLFLLQNWKRIFRKNLCQENRDSDHFHDDTEICKLEASFEALNGSVIALTNTTLEETENDKYLLEKENLRPEKELDVFKNKHANLKALIQEKKMTCLPIMVHRMFVKGRGANKRKLRKWKIYFLSYRASLEKLTKNSCLMKKCKCWKKFWPKLCLTNIACCPKFLEYAFIITT